jgi:hypothetical protein
MERIRHALHRLRGHDLPNQALPNTFEKANSPFGLGSFDWFHLSQEFKNCGKVSPEETHDYAFHAAGNATCKCLGACGDAIAVGCVGQ